MSKKIPSIYNPQTGMIGCVILQVANGCGTEIATMFGSDAWEVNPMDGQSRMEATRDQWSFLAAMTPAERVERWNAHS